MKILKQAEIRSASDFSKLRIVDWHRLNGYWQNDVTMPLSVISAFLSNHATYTLIEDDLTVYPVRDDWPNWVHAGNGSHERLGRLYWNMFYACFGGEGTLIMGDMPDFQGTLAFPGTQPVKFFGDIGQVSASTFVLDVLPKFTFHDLWITVFDEKHHLILEIQGDIQRVLSERMEEVFGIH